MGPLHSTFSLYLARALGDVYRLAFKHKFVPRGFLSGPVGSLMASVKGKVNCNGNCFK